MECSNGEPLQKAQSSITVRRSRTSQPLVQVFETTSDRIFQITVSFSKAGKGDLDALTVRMFIRPIGYKTVWRGVTDLSINDYIAGEEKVWWGFTSCTSVCGTLEDAAYFDQSCARTMFSIETSSGRSIRSHSNFMAEDEILLPPGIRLKVVSKAMLVESCSWLIWKISNHRTDTSLHRFKRNSEKGANYRFAGIKVKLLKFSSTISAK